MGLDVTSFEGLTEEQLDFYDREGYLVSTGVFSQEEINSLAKDVDDVIRERARTLHPKNMRVRFRPNATNGDQVVEVIDPISDLSALAKSICLDQRLTAKVASIYGEPCCLFKDKYFCKPPGTDGIPLHQDWIAWPTFPTTFLTVLVAVDPFNQGSGATKVYPRMHSQGYLSRKDGLHHLLKHEEMVSGAICLNLEPGDIAIFSCFTPHFSEANQSDLGRRGYFVSYNALSDGGQRWASHYSEFHEWIRSRYPEELRSQLEFV